MQMNLVGLALYVSRKTLFLASQIVVLAIFSSKNISSVPSSIP